jgi:hypothetical protein
VGILILLKKHSKILVWKRLTAAQPDFPRIQSGKLLKDTVYKSKCHPLGIFFVTNYHS